jgi:TolB protein
MAPMKNLLLLLSLLAASPAFAALEINVTGGETSALPIAVVPFARPSDVTVDIAGIVAANLARTGQFDPMPAGEMLERPSTAAQVNYRNWRAVAVDHVVVGALKRGGDGKLSVHVEVLDVLRAQGVAAWDVTVPDPRNLRGVAHYIADLIYEKLTGIPGCFNSQIAYVAMAGTPKSRLYKIIVADADGHNPRTWAQSAEPLLSPTWSPDRKRLAYVGYERGRSAIYIQSIETGELRKFVAEKGINGAPAWSPDGRQLAMTLSFGRNPDIFVLDIATGARRQLTQHFAIDTEPAWSPDGKEIAFTSDRGGQPQIYVVPSTGGEARRLTFEGRQNLRPRYSPDGKSMALVNVDQTGYRIGLLDLATRELRLLSAGPLDESPSFAPNGAIVIYSTKGKQGNELATVSVDGRFRSSLSQPGNVYEPAWSPVIR